MGTPIAVIGVDIGWTKILAGAVDVRPGGFTDHLVAVEHRSTPRLAPPAFYDALADTVRRVQRRLARMGYAVPSVVAVAHPGRFRPDGTLARATTPNLGTAPGQFDGRSPSRELSRRLGMRVIAENDAVAQMRYGLDALLRDPAARPRLLGHTVVYLGPGTGMGGGVARVSRAGRVTPVTDGHFFDLQIPAWGDGRQTAEELFTGPAIARAIARVNARLAAPIRPAKAESLDRLLQRDQTPSDPIHRAAERIADEQGAILAALIETIRAGHIVKVRLEPLAGGRVRRHVDEPDHAWSAADQALVRGARRFILGGSVGMSRGLGARIRYAALARLAARGLGRIEIVQIPVSSGNAGLLGVVRAVPLRGLTP